MGDVPALEPHCGSWIITRTSTGEAIGEFYDRTVVERINQNAYTVETAATYLGRLNSSHKVGKGELS